MNSITVVATSQTNYETEYTLDGAKNFSIFLTNSLSQIRLFHWYSDSYQVHKILGDLYNSLNELYDELMEEIIGTVKEHKISFNICAPQINLSDTELYKTDFCGKIAEIYNSLDSLVSVFSCLEFKTFIDSTTSGINNTKESILTAINKSKYLLNIVNV